MALYHYQAELALAPQEVWFVGYILAHRWTDALPYPSLRRMSRRTGISTQMLHRYKQSLIQKGYLITFPRHRPSGGRSSNFYDFTALFQRLEAFLVRDRRDGSWKPTADEPAEETLDDLDGETEDVAVPPSQQSEYQAGVTWGEVAASVRQRELSGASSPTLTGGGREELMGPRTASFTGSAAQSGPQKERLSVQDQPRDRARAAGAENGAKRALARRKETMGATAAGTTASGELPLTPTSPHFAEDGPWQVACAALAATVSRAAYEAWIAPLRPAPAVPAEAAGMGPAPELPANAEPLRLVCCSAFQRDQIERRYRRLIEDAVGRSIELLVGA